MTPIDVNLPAWVVVFSVAAGAVILIISITLFVAGLRLRLEAQTARGANARRELMRWSSWRYAASTATAVIGGLVMLAPVIYSAAKAQ
jgi:uncharacterized membrane protein